MYGFEKPELKKPDLKVPDVRNYFKEMFTCDLKAGFVTAIVALPLAIGFAVASGVDPVLGLYSAIISGILGSTFGGSRYAITGPTGAMTVIILSTVTQFGLEGLFLTSILAGFIQILMGIFKVGRLIKFIPQPIISGFTAGIGLLIIFGQVPNMLGLSLTPHTHIYETLRDTLFAAGNTDIAALAVTIACILIIIFLPRLFSGSRILSSVPSSFIVIVLSIILIYAGITDLPTVGAVPVALPSFSFIRITPELFRDVLPSAFTMALLGTISSLLCVVVCDSMTATKHDSQKELVSQGICNIVLPLFGTMPVAGAVARSIVNIREGAKTRMAGVIHGIVLLLALVFFGPYGAYLPKAAVAAVLICVAAKMVNLHEIRMYCRRNRSEAAIYLITMSLTVISDIVFAIEVGMILVMVNFFYDMTKTMSIETAVDDRDNQRIRKIIEEHPLFRDRLAIYTINGPFFFGAMNVFDRKVNEHLKTKRQIIIVRMRHVPFIDTTAIMRLNAFIESRHNAEKYVLITGIRPEVKKHLLLDETFEKYVRSEYVWIFDSTEEAVRYATDVLVPAIDAGIPVSEVNNIVKLTEELRDIEAAREQSGNERPGPTTIADEIRMAEAKKQAEKIIRDEILKKARAERLRAEEEMKENFENL